MKWDTRGADINALVFSPDGHLAAAASADGSVILLDIPKDQINFLEGHQGPVRDVDFSPDGKQVLSGSADGSIILWDAVTGNLIRTILSQDIEVGNVAFAPDGQRILSSLAFTALLMDLATGAAAWSIYLGSVDAAGRFPDSYEAETFCEWQPAAGYSILASPAVSESGIVVVGTLEGHLVAIGDESW